MGDVIGKYHPHGDVAVYDALVRLAQDTTLRYPLVEGQGNFGNIDGDNAATIRCRIPSDGVCHRDAEGIDESGRLPQNYDGSEESRCFFRLAFQTCCNGAAIAVGMATIPPLDDVCAALLHLLKFPNATIANSWNWCPDRIFRLGRSVEDRSVAEAYATGRGSFRLRAKWEVEKLGHGQYQVVITEIPYQVQRPIVEKIADLLNAKKLAPGDIQDERGRHSPDLEPRNRSIEPDVLMEQMFRMTTTKPRQSECERSGL